MLSQKEQQRTKSITKTTHSLASPFPDPSWPQIQLADQETILDLLCILLADLGHYHRSLVVSKGKRRRREKLKQEDDKPSEEIKDPPRPEIRSHILIGFNEVQRHLEAMISRRVHAKVDEGQESSKEMSSKVGHDSSDTDNALVAVFIDRSAQPLIMTRHLPAMVATASKDSTLWLITLPNGAGTRLGETVGIPRLGFCGLLAKAPGSIPLIHYIKERIQPIQPSLITDIPLSAKFFPLQVATYSVEVESKSGKPKRQLRKMALDGNDTPSLCVTKKRRRRKPLVSQ